MPEGRDQAGSSSEAHRLERLHLEQLVLHGFSAGQAGWVEAAVMSRLHRLAAGRGFAPNAGDALHVPHLEVAVGRGASVEAVADRVVAAIQAAVNHPAPRGRPQ